MKCVLNNSNAVPIFGRSVSYKETENFKNAEQYYSDCYLMATVDSLTNSYNGRRILQQQLEIDNNNENINCYLYSPTGEKEKYVIPANTAISGYEDLYKNQNNKYIRALDISVAEYEKRHSIKPFICRLSEIVKTYRFENNVPAHFMEQLTGVKPITVGSTYKDLTLKGHREELMQLFQKMAKEKHYSFVLTSGYKKFNGRRYHAYIIEDVNLEKNTITIKEKRKNTPQEISIDEALSVFCAMSGYFESDLAKNLPKEYSREFTNFGDFWKKEFAVN